MLDVNELELRSECDYYTSYDLPNNCVLFVAKTTKTYEKDEEWITRDASYAEKATMLTSTFSSAMIAGKDMIRKGECERFTLQTVDVAKDEPDTGMIILMVQ